MLNVGRDQADGLRKMISRGASKSRVITFLAGAASTENDLMLTNLGASLNATGSSVLLVDARPNGVGIANKLGLSKRSTAWDAAFKDSQPPGLIQDVPGLDGVQAVVLGMPRSGSHGSMEVNHFNTYFSDLVKGFDMVLVDAELTTGDRLPISVMESGEIVIQVSSSSESIKTAYVLMKRLTSSIGRRPYSILVTGVSEKASTVVYENMAKTASQFLAVPLNSVGSMPADEHLLKANNLGRTVVDAFPLAGVSIAFRKLAGKFSSSPLATKA